jgi:6-phosphogluconolactonase
MTNHQADYRFHEYANDADYVAGVTAAIVTGLKLRTSHEQRAQLLLSGGASPAPVYEALSTQNLDWSLVDIGLVDERWVVNTSQRKSASNAAMVTKTLHTENTAKATIHTLADYASDMPSSIANANKQFQTPTVVVLGMGIPLHFFRMRRNYVKRLIAKTPTRAWMPKVALWPANGHNASR